MPPFDRGVRDLLPFLQADSDELGIRNEVEEGAAAQDAPSPDVPAVSTPAPAQEMDLPQPGGHVIAATSVTAQGAASSGASSEPIPAKVGSTAVDGPSTAPDDGRLDSTSDQIPLSGGGSAGVRAQARDADAPDGAGEPSGENASDEGTTTSRNEEMSGSDSPEDGPASGGALPGGPVAQQNPAIPEEAEETGHDIAVSQIADVDQDATILVEGYVGSVVTRFHVDQDIRMDQDADIDVDVDGSGHFRIFIGQRMYINQETEIDIDIYDEGGILYVDLFLRDLVEVDQDVDIDFDLYDGLGGNELTIVQDLEMDQDTDIDIEIEDELEDRYTVRVDVAVRQDVDAEQDAELQIASHDGDLEVDIQSDQVAAIDQETLVKLDFALV